MSTFTLSLSDQEVLGLSEEEIEAAKSLLVNTASVVKIIFYNLAHNNIDEAISLFKQHEADIVKSITPTKIWLYKFNVLMAYLRKDDINNAKVYADIVVADNAIDLTGLDEQYVDIFSSFMIFLARYANINNISILDESLAPYRKFLIDHQSFFPYAAAAFNIYAWSCTGLDFSRDFNDYIDEMNEDILPYLESIKVVDKFKMYLNCLIKIQLIYDNLGFNEQAIAYSAKIQKYLQEVS